MNGLSWIKLSLEVGLEARLEIGLEASLVSDEHQCDLGKLLIICILHSMACRISVVDELEGYYD